MRVIHLFIACWLLTNAALSSACHTVGDVHVICSSQGLETVYVPSPETADEARPSAECCPSAPIAVLQGLDLAQLLLTNLAPRAWVSWPQHALRFDSAAVPRAPPKSVSI